MREEPRLMYVKVWLTSGNPLELRYSQLGTTLGLADPVCNQD